MNCVACVIAIAAICCATSALSHPFFDPRSELSDAIEGDAAFAAAPRDAACFASTMVSTGGAAPRSPHTLAVRWAGFSNFELAYGGKIILLDTFFDRGSNYTPLGFKAADVTKANVILIGHAHFDHMSDAASIGMRTGAMIVGAPVTTEKLAAQGVPAAQIKAVTGRGEELLKFDGFTVQPILARHGQPDKHITEVMEGALDSVAPRLTPEQVAEQKIIMERGTFDPRIISEGTIAYLIRFDDGFSIIYRDSGGQISEQERIAFANIAGVDLALMAITADFLNPLTAKQALAYAQLFKPTVFMPAHHDAGFSGHTPLWRATEPVFQALKDDKPVVTVSRGYREPVCFDTEINLAHPAGR